jgi:gamma-glutamyltranspeptidase/glutathione hydrolase
MALRKARAVVAASGEVEAAASELLGRGNAVDAVVAGVFAACAASPGVLLGPVQVLVGGAGAGLLAIDGRVRQPGIGAPRPRGFTTPDEVPDAARVGVPWLPASLSVALATMGTATFAQVLAPAVALAKGTARSEILARIASRGPRAIEERPLGGELLAAFGRPSGGLLTSDDLSSPRPDVQKATPIDRAPRGVVTFPWSHLEESLPAAPAHGVDVARARGVVAVDRNATFAVACWDEATDGLMLGDLGLRAPFFAEPVRRGQTRVRPGDARPAAGPAALIASESGPEIAFCAFGAGDAYEVLGQAIGAYLDGERIEAHGFARLVAVAHAKGAASVLAG